MHESPRLSIIVPSFRTRNTISRCLAPLFEQETDIPFEVIVVDSTPDDSVREEVKKFPGVRFIHLETQTPPGPARNRGAREARAPLFFFLDADIAIEDKTIQRLVLRHDQGTRVFSGALEVDDPKSASLSAWLEHLFFLHEYQRSRPKPEKRRNLGSTTLVVERELFDKSQGFPTYPRCEDVWFTENLSGHGLTLLFDPAIVGYRVQKCTFRTVFSKSFAFGRDLYYVKYSSWPIPKRGTLLAMLPALALAKVTRIIYRNLRYHEPTGKIRCLTLIPLLYFCGLLWMLGVYRAVLLKRSNPPKRIGPVASMTPEEQ